MKDDFEELLEAQDTDKPSVAVGDEPNRDRMPNNLIRDLIVRPDVARAIAEGVPLQEIADQLGVSKQTIRKWMDRAPMQDLLEIESRRVVRHLSRRNLGKEKYLGLTAALGILIDKARGIRDGVSEQPTVINQTFIEKMDVALFGLGGRKEGTSPDPGVTELAEGSVRQIPEESDIKTGK
jgi:hypothetical protein